MKSVYAMFVNEDSQYAGDNRRQNNKNPKLNAHRYKYSVHMGYIFSGSEYQGNDESKCNTEQCLVARRQASREGRSKEKEDVERVPAERQQSFKAPDTAACNQ